MKMHESKGGFRVLSSEEITVVAGGLYYQEEPEQTQEEDEIVVTAQRIETVDSDVWAYHLGGNTYALYTTPGGYMGDFQPATEDTATLVLQDDADSTQVGAGVNVGNVGVEGQYQEDDGPSREQYWRQVAPQSY